MKRWAVACVLGLFGAPNAAVATSVEEILSSIDRNLNFETRYTLATMTVSKPRRDKIY